MAATPLLGAATKSNAGSTILERRMSRGQSKKKHASARYISIYHAVLEHPDFYEANPRCHKMLLYLLRQFNGSNNGDFTAAYSVLKKFGFKSKDTIASTLQELIDRGLIVRTREAKFQNPNATCALYAVTWFQIHECGGKLDVQPTTDAIRNFAVETCRSTRPKSRHSSNQNSGRKRLRGRDGRFVSSE